MKPILFILSADICEVPFLNQMPCPYEVHMLGIGLHGCDKATTELAVCTAVGVGGGAHSFLTDEEYFPEELLIL